MGTAVRTVGRARGASTGNPGLRAGGTNFVTRARRRVATGGAGRTFGGNAGGTALAAGDLKIAFPASQEPASLDGHIDPYQSTWLFNSFVADPLVVLAPDGSYLPALATGWSSSPDGRVWTFKLRSGVTFQDGTPFDAEAVRFNLERIAAPETASKQLKSDIGPFARVDTPDPLTVVVTYDTPWVTLLDAVRRMPIWSPTAVQKLGREFERSLVGTGPFTLVERRPNDSITFERWPGYGGWNAIQKTPGPVALDSVTIRFIGEAAVLGSVVRTGDADVAFAMTAQYVEDYKDSKDFQFYAKGQAGSGLARVMNTRRPPLDDIRVRRALQHAANQEAVNELLYDGLYVASDGPLNNIHPCFWDGAIGLYPHDVEKAKALLEEAGWKAGPGGMRVASGVRGVADGTPLRIRWSTLHHQEIGEAMQAQFRLAGIDLAVERVPGPVQLDRVQKRDFELIYERQRSPDPLILDQVWNSKWDQPGGWAWTGFKDAALDVLLDQLRSIPDADRRCEVAKQAQKIIMENALLLPTLSQPVFVALSSKVKGFEPGAEGNWFFLHNTALN